MFIKAGDTHELSDIAKTYYDESKKPLPSNTSSSLRFDSRFESGNLFAAFMVT